MHQTVFVDHRHREGLVINLRYISRARAQRNEADLRFESKSQSIDTYWNWVMEVLTMPGITDTLTEASVRKVLDISTSMSTMRSYTDLELLISRWSVETHPFLCCLRRVHSHTG